jgi:hypothetical protein
MEFPDGKTFRIAHDWSDRVQPVTCEGDIPVQTSTKPLM